MATVTKWPACTTAWIFGRISSRVPSRPPEPLRDINRYVKWLKPPVFLLSLGPVAALAYKAYHDTQFPDAVPLLSGNPQSFIRNSTGFWTLVFICITIGITPVRRVLHQNWLVRFRRMMGLFAFFYGTLHFVTYFLFDTGVNFSAV